MEHDMQQVVDLIVARIEGGVTNEQVEDAVSRVLKHEKEIEEDDGNYDDDNDEKGVEKSVKKKAATTSRQTPAPRQSCRKRPATALQEPPKSLSRRKKEAQFAKVAHIPLGKQGSLMLTAFGDGREPLPETVKLVLQGARRKLQVALQDARHVRRQQKDLYESYKKATQSTKQKFTAHNKEYWTPDIMYRATVGYDNLAYDEKCGFSTSELAQVCPEEMHAYRQWSILRQEAEERTTEEQAATGHAADSSEKTGEEQNHDKDNDHNQLFDEVTSHLRTRARQFDVRTNRMEAGWYLRFADIRQGSFLPRARLNADEDNQRRQGQTQWSRFSVVEARFLHWLGFDPSSALPPPNVETTHALAFLGYSFFGDIVEKAIFFKNLAREQQRSGQTAVDESRISLELSEGEQLQSEDIQRAMEDPAVKPVPIYSSDVRRELKPQLYFGPGFESRLEMELDEIISNKMLSSEELEMRTKEDELFEQLAKSPKLDGIASILDADEEKEDDAKPEAKDDEHENGDA